MVPRVITCARCGNETIATGPRTKYCPPCAYFTRLEKQNARRTQQDRHAEHTKVITCEICGKEAVVSSKAARAKYCPECSSKAFKVSTEKHRKKERRWLLAEPRIIKCERCGCEVVLEDVRQFKRKYCDDCQKIVYAELRKKAKDAFNERNRTDDLTGNQKQCERCGTIFVRQGFRKYCDDCRIIVKREQEAAHKKKQRDGWRTGELPVRRKKNPRVSQIEAINDAARKAGMSYGQYQAMKAMGRV